MSTWKINLNKQTATSINGITFKLTETKPGEYEGVCLNPKDIPPDDFDDVIVDGENLADVLVEACMAVKYDVGRKLINGVKEENKWER